MIPPPLSMPYTIKQADGIASIITNYKLKNIGNATARIPPNVEYKDRINALTITPRKSGICNMTCIPYL